MEEYKSNSVINREPDREKCKPIVKGDVSVKKQGRLAKLFASDAETAKNYLFSDVFVPAIKKAIGDIVIDGIRVILYGESSKSADKSYRPSSRISYASYYNEPRDPYVDNRISSTRNYDIFEDYEFKRVEDAEDVLRTMIDICDRYSNVRVDDYYDLIGKTAPYTAHSYGWYNIRDARIQYIASRDRWVIKFPKAVPIERR